MDFTRCFEGAAPQKLIHRLAWITVAFTYFLVALGATVRVNNAGLSCPDWPLCYGSIFSMESIGALLEESHRYTASIVSILVIALVLSILLWARHDKCLLIPAIIAPCLLVVQIILGGLTVLMKLEGAIITLHLATAEALFAIILFIAIMAGNKVPNQEPAEKTHQFARLAVLNALLIYLLLLSGSYVFNTGASLACPGWPLCGAAPDWAVKYHLDDINMLHRYIAAIIGLVIIWTLLSAWRRRNVVPGQACMAIAAGILFIIQSGVGALVVLWNRPIYIADLHLAIATAVWACMVILATMAMRQSLITSQVVIAESEPINEYHIPSY
jgi:heme A synthase